MKEDNKSEQFELCYYPVLQKLIKKKPTEN